MSKDFADKVVIVTGAANGLGRAVAVALGEQGGRVTLVDVDEDGLEETRRLVVEGGGKALVVPADVSDPDQVKGYVDATVEAFGRIDGLFNNAGILGAAAPLVDYPVDAFDLVQSVNLKGVFLGLKYVLPVLAAQGSGSIVNTGSMASTGGIPYLTGYAASKHGVVGLTKVAAIEMANTGVRVNAMLPGSIKTRMALQGIPGSTDAEKEAFGAASVPQGRMGVPSEISDAVLFLLSDRSRHVTGIELPVDGGITAQVYPSASQLS